MSESSHNTRRIPPELINQFGEVRAAIVGQKYREALSILEVGLKEKYAAEDVDSADLLEQFCSLVVVLEFNLRQAYGIDWEKRVKVPAIPEKETKCSFCSKTYAEVQKFITGAEGNICSECIAICNEILAEE